MKKDEQRVRSTFISQALDTSNKVAGLLFRSGSLTSATATSRRLAHDTDPSYSPRSKFPVTGRVGAFQRSPAGAGRANWGMVLTKLVSLCFLTSAVVIFFNVLTGRHQELADEVSSVLHQSFTRSTFEVHDPKVLEVRHEEVAGMEIVLVRSKDPRGVLLVLHGCMRRPTDWWHYDPACVTCIGLPEEMAISRAALARSFDVLALTPKEQAYRCWDTEWPTRSEDVPRVIAVWDDLEARDYGYKGLPKYALGVSSGGAMALVLAQFFPLQGISSQIMGIRPSLLTLPKNRTTMNGRPWRYPPTFFVYMARDVAMAEWISLDADKLKSQGVYVKKVSVLPRPITPTFFSDRMASLDNATSAAIYHALQGAHMLDLQDMLVQDPRPSAPRWRQVLQENVPALRGVSLEAETSPIHELLNVAWAGHEIVSDYADDMFAFWERPGPDEAELMPVGGISARAKLRGGALWNEDKGLSGRRM
ncbi:hypothetical protein COCOBI_10-3970 [Coccomyxa sp. Obi]|nr:hypothetical protein COCOBI_10-3970 [Coccomyxa sp. Obi]